MSSVSCTLPEGSQGMQTDTWLVSKLLQGQLRPTSRYLACNGYAHDAMQNFKNQEAHKHVIRDGGSDHSGHYTTAREQSLSTTYMA